jgi:hypothetical protein
MSKPDRNIPVPGGPPTAVAPVHGQLWLKGHTESVHFLLFPEVKEEFFDEVI